MNASQLFDICKQGLLILYTVGHICPSLYPALPRVVVARGIIHLEAVAGVVGPRREQPAATAGRLGRRAPRAGRGRPLDGRRRAHHVRVDLGQRLHRLVAADQAAAAAAAHGRGGRVAAHALPPRPRRLGAHEGVRAAAKHTLAAAPEKEESYRFKYT